MEKTSAPHHYGRTKIIKPAERLSTVLQEAEKWSAEEFFEQITKMMFRIILFLGIPYFFYVLFQFIHMVS